MEFNLKCLKILVPFLILILVTCKKDDSVLTTVRGDSGISYHDSFSKWNRLKSKNGNSYIYQTKVVSWTGFGSITELTVVNGEVVSRNYQEFLTGETNGEPEIIDSYAETKLELGSHEKGARPLTIDELYNSCAGEYLNVDEKNNTLYFETESNGLMTLCGFVPIGCADDCFRGIRISSFRWAE